MSKMSDKELENFLDNIPGLPKPPAGHYATHPSSPCMGQDLDAMEILQKKLAQRQAGIGFDNQSPHGQVRMPEPVNMQTEQKVYLRPGFPTYTAVSNDISHVNIAMKAGNTEQLQGKELVLGTPGNFLLVENHNAIDLSNVNSTMLTKMVMVKTFWEGNYIVPEAAIVKIGNKQHGLLKG